MKMTSKLENKLIKYISNMYDCHSISGGDIRIWIEKKNFPYPFEITQDQITIIRNNISLIRNIRHIKSMQTGQCKNNSMDKIPEWKSQR